MTLHELWITVNDAGGAHYHPLGESEAREHAAAHGFRVALLREVVTCATCAHGEPIDLTACGSSGTYVDCDDNWRPLDWFCADWQAKVKP
jgi:hypothetical protein